MCLLRLIKHRKSNSMFIVEKLYTYELCICIDPGGLNEAEMWKHYQTLTSKDKLARAKYWMIGHSTESQNYIHFMLIAF